MTDSHFFELSPAQFSLALPVYQELHFCIPLYAVLEGNSPGRVFVDHPETPGVAFTWTRWGYFYLAGAVDNQDFIAALRQRLENELIPDSIAAGERWPLIYPSSQAWERKIDFLLGRRPYQKLFRRIFSFNPEKFRETPGWRTKLPPGYELQRLDERLLASLDDLQASIAATWNSLDAFLQRGLGFCLMRDGRIVSSCLALFSGAGSFEINVETQEAYFRQGLAKIVCAAFIEECLERRLRPNWECWSTNQPSTALAAGLGFESQFDLPVYWWEESG